MTDQILNNLKFYLAERRKNILDRYECTESDYSSGKLDGLEEIINYITGEEMSYIVDNSNICKMQ